MRIKAEKYGRIELKQGVGPLIPNPTVDMVGSIMECI